MNFQENLFGNVFLVTLMQLWQPKNVIKVTQAFLHCGLYKMDWIMWNNVPLTQ